MKKDNKLTIESLHTSIEGKEILKGIDLKVLPGEIHVVMGPNGGGKSTLAHSLMGHPSYEIKNSKSKIKIDGEDIVGLSPDERAKKGLFLAFQYPVSIDGVSVQKFLWKSYQAIHPKAKVSVVDFRKKIYQVTDELTISRDLLKRSLNDGFSGGEKKRIEILQLMLFEPKYVILDEIDSGLDVDAIKLVAKGIKDAVKKHNVGVIIVTHYRRIVDHLDYSRVHVLMDGKIVKSGGKELLSKLEKDGYKDFYE